MVAPNDLLETIGIPDPTSVWRITLGFVVVILGYYYMKNAKANLSPFFRITVQVRMLQFLFFLWLYFFDRGTLTLVAFSFVELAAGLWTWMALRKASA